MARKRSKNNVTVEETLDAMRRYEAERIETVYASAVKAVGSELQFSSARHLATGVFGLLPDLFCTLWGPVKQVVQSPQISKFVEEKLGEGKTLVDYLAVQVGQGKSKTEKEDFDKNRNKLLESLSRSEAYVQAVTDYSKQTGKTPDQVIRSKKDMVVVLERAYGSVEEYVKIQTGTAESFTKAVSQLDKLQSVPLEYLVSSLLESKLDVDLGSLSEAGINPVALGLIVKNYVHDVAKFGKAFLTEYAKQETESVKQYQVLSQN